MVTANTKLRLQYQILKLLVHIELDTKNVQLVVLKNWSNSTSVPYINYYGTDIFLSKLPVLDKGKKAKITLLIFIFFLKVITYI